MSGSASVTLRLPLEHRYRIMNYAPLLMLRCHLEITTLTSLYLPPKACVASHRIPGISLNCFTLELTHLASLTTIVAHPELLLKNVQYTNHLISNQSTSTDVKLALERLSIA